MHPADFYTGIVADLYAPLRSAVPDPEPYARFVARVGEPALELGCGDGDPLIELRRRGLDVEGVDSSADMLERCRRRAAEAGVEVVVHHQRMEQLDLPGRYRSIFLAGPTFCLLTDDEVAGQALGRIRHHLAEEGRALVPLFVPPPSDPDEMGRARESTDADGSTIAVTLTAVERDEGVRTQCATLRYERRSDGVHQIEDRRWMLHWYGQDEFRALALGAGLTRLAVLDAQGRPADTDDDQFTFVLEAVR